MWVIGVCSLVLLKVLFSVVTYSGVITWEEIQSDYIDTRRSPVQLMAYLSYLSRLKLSGISPETAVLENVFNLSNQRALECSDGHCVLESQLVFNRYPYWLEDDVVHLLLFMSGKDWQEKSLQEESNGLLKKSLGELVSRYSLEWRIYVNPPHKRSVGLAHAHIFLKGVNSEEIAHQVKRALMSGKAGHEL
ncbi:MULTISPECIES: GIG1 family protein [unclassified Endozoicomonas]|uniref:GIG1 family protein n=1 Tax=unclassified Endozoicomonas TaxID=2644528 RepID=UPI00214871DA|nr:MULTISPECIES: GIG1 family protein [unclassified Endozoicomonas]